MGRANEPLPRRPVVDDRHKRTSQRQCRQCVLKRWRNKSSDGGFRGQTLGAGTLLIFLHSLQIPVKKSVKSLLFLVLAAGSNKMFSLPLISTLSFQDFLKKKKTKKKIKTKPQDQMQVRTGFCMPSLTGTYRFPWKHSTTFHSC